MKKIEVIVARPVAVSIKDLTVSDLRSFEKDQLVEISVGLLELLKEQSHTKVAPEMQTPLETAPVAPKAPEPAVVEAIPTDTKEALEIIAKQRVKGYNRNGDHNIGFKSGVTSKFHYVSYNKKAKKKPWEAALKIDGKQQSKRFATEEEAALSVDLQLDFLQDKKRPRNRDKHSEIMTAYKSQ